MIKVPLAKFNRDYYGHDRLGGNFILALESFKLEVHEWKEATGIQFNIIVANETDQYMACEVTKVWAEFNSNADYAMYKLHNPTPHIATDIVNLQFASWQVAVSA